MRTAVVRVRVDPAGALGAADFGERTERLVAQANAAGMTVIMIPTVQCRELQVLMSGGDGEFLRDVVKDLCARVFQTSPEVEPVTYVSRGTDDDLHGVLAGFGIAGDISRGNAEGFDVVTVRLAAACLERVPESRVHTALEAAVNGEVRIIVV